MVWSYGTVNSFLADLASLHRPFPFPPFLSFSISLLAVA